MSNRLKCIGIYRENGQQTNVVKNLVWNIDFGRLRGHRRRVKILEKCILLGMGVISVQCNTVSFRAEVGDPANSGVLINNFPVSSGSRSYSARRAERRTLIDTIKITRWLAEKPQNYTSQELPKKP